MKGWGFLLLILFSIQVQAQGLSERLSEARGYLPVQFSVDALRESRVNIYRGERDTFADVEFNSRSVTLEISREALFQGASAVVLTTIMTDVSYQYFRALAFAHLMNQSRTNSNLGQWLRSQSAASVKGVPSQHKLEVFIESASWMISEAMTLANLYQRFYLKHGKGLCKKFDFGLFKKWERVFKNEIYPGAYYDKRRREWKETGFSVSPKDRERLRTDVLGSFWTGQLLPDFADRYCQ